MARAAVRPADADWRPIPWLTYLKFLMSAMTTDFVGVVVERVIGELGLSMRRAGALPDGSTLGIAGAARPVAATAGPAA